MAIDAALDDVRTFRAVRMHVARKPCAQRERLVVEFTGLDTRKGNSTLKNGKNDVSHFKFVVVIYRNKRMFLPNMAESICATQNSHIQFVLLLFRNYASKSICHRPFVSVKS